MTRSLTVAFTFLAACSFGGDFGNTRYQCGEGGRCPDGQSCVAGFCTPSIDVPVDATVVDPEPDAVDDPDAAVTDASAADASVDAAVMPPDGPPPPTPVCGNMGLLTDGFDTAGARPAFESFTEPGVQVNETGGQLVIAVGGGAGTAFGGYRSSYAYDLRESALEATVTSVGGGSTIVEVRNLQDQAAQLAWENGMISARVLGAGGATTRRTIAFTPTHIYWRIRVSNNVMSWETSANRTSWTVVHSEPAPFDIRHVHGVLRAGGEAPALTASKRALDGVGAPTSPGFCAGSTLVDDFAAAPLTPTWSSSRDGTCTITETGGKLVLGFTGFGVQFCDVVATHLYDLTASAIVIDSAELPGRANFVSYLQLVSPQANNSVIEISRDNGTLSAINRNAGTNTDSNNVAYNATNHRYWRLRGVGGQVEIAVSANGTSFTPRLTTTPAFPLDRVEVRFGAGHYFDVNPVGAVTASLPGVNAP